MAQDDPQNLAADPGEEPVKALLAVILGVFMLGPLGLFIVVPAVIGIWLVAGASATGPAAGA